MKVPERVNTTPRAEATTRTRTDRVCADGVMVDRVVSMSARVTRWTRPQRRYIRRLRIRPIAEAATRTRTDRVCADGVGPAESSDDCTRVADGLVLNEDVGACELTPLWKPPPAPAPTASTCHGVKPAESYLTTAYVTPTVRPQRRCIRRLEYDTL